MAVIAALELLLMAAVVALKVVDVAAAATVTEAGTVRVALVFVRVTLAPPARAGWVKVTVQELDELGPRLVGLHVSEETSTGVRLIPVPAEVPLYVAVTIALWELEIVVAVAWKVAVVAPAATVTDAGTVKAALLSERATTTPPLWAAMDSVTVQVEADPDVSVAGVH